MPLSDLARAIPGLVLFGLVPGFGLASCLVPRWSAWLRLAAAPGLSAGVLSVLGLAAHDASVAYRAWWVALLGVALLAAGAWRLRTHGASAATPGNAGTANPAARLRANAPQLIALFCGLLVAGTVATALRAEPLPLDADPAVHAAVAERIASQGDFLPAIPDPADQSAIVRPRNGGEAVAALSAAVGADSPTSAILPVALLAALLAPLSICLLALELTRNRAIAALTPVLAAGFPYPSLPLTFGEMPLIVDSTLIVPLAVAALRVVRDVDRRAGAAMVLASTAGIWAVHGTEVITVAVIAAPLALLVLFDGMPPARWWRGVAIALLATAAGALLVTLLTHTPAVPHAAAIAGSGTEVPESSTVGGGVSLRDFPRDFMDFVFPSRLFLIGWIAGLYAAWRMRALRGLLIAHVALVLILADVSTHRYGLRIWERVFPWSEPDRLASDQYWVLPVMMAAGLVCLTTALAPLWKATLTTLRSRMAGGIAAALVVAAVALGTGHDHDARLYADARVSVGMVSTSDLVVMRAMAAAIPPGTPVMADGIDDAGQWVIALTPDELFMSKDFVISHPHDTRVAAIAAACFDPQAARAALAGAGAVFVGSRERAGTKSPWDADCVGKAPGLRLIARSGRSAAFAVAP